jgi:hypothetical protein
VRVHREGKRGRQEREREGEGESGEERWMDRGRDGQRVRVASCK